MVDDLVVVVHEINKLAIGRSGNEPLHPTVCWTPDRSVGRILPVEGDQADDPFGIPTLVTQDFLEDFEKARTELVPLTVPTYQDQNDR